jgi:hypothetical protein
MWVCLINESPDRPSKRKERLFAVACCRRIWRLLSGERLRRAVDAVERYADGVVGETDRGAAQEEAVAAYVEADDAGDMIARYAADAVEHAAETADDYFIAEGVAYKAQHAVGHSVTPGGSGVDPMASPATKAAAQVEESEEQAQMALLRDIFMSPFRPVALDSAWQTPTILALAHAAYENRLLPAGTLEPARLAVLADALEEAGCDDADILNHCRQSGEHVRGCWVLDLLLGKEVPGSPLGAEENA